MDQTLFEILSEFAINLKFNDLPDKVISKANDCFFDLVGCFYGALRIQKNRFILDEIGKFNTSPEVLLWGSGKFCGVAEAALAIGTLAYDLEYDDGVSLGGHWGSASIPSTFLAIQKSGGDGRDLLTAIVASYEVGTRISRLYSPKLLDKHIHFPCTMGAFGAATGYAKGSGVSHAVLSDALTLAGLFPIAPYSTAISGASGKSLYSGWPNYLGINVVRLAKIGLSGGKQILEHKDGFSAALNLGTTTKEMKNKAITNLKNDYRFLDVYFKPYPCCRWLHEPISATLNLFQKNPIPTNQIEEIVVYGPEFSSMYDTHNGFDSKVVCQYSIPYSIGAAIYFKKLGLEEYELEARTNPDLIKLIQMIRVEPKINNGGNLDEKFRVEVKMKNNKVIHSSAKMPWGPDNPPVKEDLIAKFAKLTENILTDDERSSWTSLYLDGFEKEGSFKKVCLLLEKKH